MATTSTDRWDAVIVGARVAGAATALLLARAGRRVLVVDRAQRGSDTLSTHALMRPAALSLDRLGVRAALHDGGTPAIRAVEFDYGGDLVTVDLRRSGTLLAPRRTVLDRVLVDAAAAAGAAVRFGAHVDDVFRDDRGRVSGVVGTVEGGQPFSASAPLVVGADGVRSVVARRVGAPVLRRGRATSGIVYGYAPTAALEAAGIRGDAYRWVYRPGATAGVIPTDGGLACVWGGASGERVRAALRSGPAAAFTALVRDAAPDLAAALDAIGEAAPAEPGRRRVPGIVGRLRGFPGLPAAVRRPHGPGWALVGDAGLFRDPVTSHGISDALRDAQLLAGAVLAGDRRLEDALAGYHADRDALAGPVLDATEAVAAFEWDLPTLRDHLFALSDAMKAATAFLSALDPQPQAA